MAQAQSRLEQHEDQASMIKKSAATRSKQSDKWLYAIPAGLLVVAFVASFLIFSNRAGLNPAVTETAAELAAEEELPGGLLGLDSSMPRTEVCPLNGVYYTVAEREAWLTRRPLAVMIENSVDARPQSGLTNADIVFEAVAEGGITRFMAIFYCDAQNEDVTLAPIRSARTYFLDLASGFNWPMYVHVGGANTDGPADALAQIGEYGWSLENDINQFSVGYPTFVRDYNRIPGKEIATEHTMTTTTESLWAVAEKRGWTNLTPKRTVGRKTYEAAAWQDGYTGWSFVDGQAGSGSQTISYYFWDGQANFDVSWSYDATTNLYTRSNGGSAHTDLNNGEKIAVSDVIVVFADETGPIDEEKHMLYDVIGNGKGLLFTNGQATEIKWSKKTRESELVFTDTAGKEISLTRGKIWVSILPTGNKVTY